MTGRNPTNSLIPPASENGGTPNACFLCGASRKATAVKDNLKIAFCRPCGLGFQETFPPAIAAIYEDISYYDAWWGSHADGERHVRLLKDMTAQWVLNQMRPFLPSGARLLEIGCAFGYFLQAAQKKSYRVCGIEISAAADQARKSGLEVHSQPLEAVAFPARSFDAVVMLDVIEHFNDPESLLKEIRRVLKETGIVALITPDVNSLARRLLGRKWPHFKQEHLYYFSRKSLSKLLQRQGFDVLTFKTAKKGMSASYLASHSAQYGNLPKFMNACLRGAFFSSAPLLVPSGLFCLATSKRVP